MPISNIINNPGWLSQEQIQAMGEVEWYDGQGMKYRRLNHDKRIDVNGEVIDDDDDQLPKLFKNLGE